MAGFELMAKVRGRGGGGDSQCAALAFFIIFELRERACESSWAVVSADAKIKDGQWLGHFVHRHEPPACAEPVEIIEKDDDKGTLIVNKPGGMAVHPTGQWRKVGGVVRTCVCARVAGWLVGSSGLHTKVSVACAEHCARCVGGRSWNSRPEASAPAGHRRQWAPDHGHDGCCCERISRGDSRQRRVQSLRRESQGDVSGPARR